MEHLLENHVDNMIREEGRAVEVIYNIYNIQIVDEKEANDASDRGL